MESEVIGWASNIVVVIDILCLFPLFIFISSINFPLETKRKEKSECVKSLISC